MNYDWKKDKFVVRWLKNRNEATQFGYRAHMKKYLMFTGMTPEALIKEKWEDMKKSPIEREDVAENRLREFNKWLQTEFKGTGYKSSKHRPLAPSSALTVCAGIADFYKRNGVPLNIKLTQEFAGAKKGINETEKMKAEQIETLASYAPTLRDRAIIWCMFQGGMDVSTVCSLNWGQVEKEIENPPMGAIMLRMLERKKEKGRTFDTFLFGTAIKHLKIYLKDRYGNDYANKLEYDSPLFVNLYGTKAGERLEPRYVQRMLRKIAPQTGIAKSRMKGSDINPLRPHALRASFSDQMSKAGARKQLVDYCMGHKLTHDRAYFGGEEGLREAYVRYAKEALEPRGIVYPESQAIKEMETTIKVLSKQIAKLQANVEPVMPVLKAMGGLPPKLLDKLIDRWIREEEERMTEDEMYGEEGD